MGQHAATTLPDLGLPPDLGPFPTFPRTSARGRDILTAAIESAGRRWARALVEYDEQVDALNAHQAVHAVAIRHSSHFPEQEKEARIAQSAEHYGRQRGKAEELLERIRVDIHDHLTDLMRTLDDPDHETDPVPAAVAAVPAQAGAVA